MVQGCINFAVTTMAKSNLRVILGAMDIGRGALAGDGPVSRSLMAISHRAFTRTLEDTVGLPILKGTPNKGLERILLVLIQNSYVSFIQKFHCMMNCADCSTV